MLDTVDIGLTEDECCALILAITHCGLVQFTGCSEIVDYKKLSSKIEAKILEKF